MNKRLGALACRRSGALWFILAAGAALLALAGCDEPVAVVEQEQKEESGPFVLSDPAAGAPSAATGVSASAGAGSQANLVYVSLPTSTVTDGKLATITHRGTGAAARTAMTDGGFDPVPILAGLGDTVAVEIQRAGSTTPLLFTYSVPRTRRPIVIRIDPPPKKRDVPLNAAIRIVFSEPLDPRSITAASIRLERAGAPVSGRTTLSADGLRAEFQPDQQLAPNTEYALVLTEDLADRSGDRLEQPVTAAFTTGVTTALATAYTDGAAMFSVGEDELRTWEFSAILHDDGRVTGTFEGFNPSAGHSIAGSVTCFGIEEGNLVWVAGVIEQATFDAIGVDAAWRAMDRGVPDSGMADLLSFAVGVDNPQEFCEKRESNPIRPAMFEVERGDVVVRQPPAGPPASMTFTIPPSNVLMSLPVHPPMRVAVVDALGYTVTDYTGSVTIALGANPAGASLWGATTVEAVGGVAVFLDVGVDRPGTGLTIVATASGLPGTESGPFDVITASPGTFVFAQGGDNGADDTGLYVWNSDGSGLTRLTSADDESPAWSPDGTRIAFERSSGDVASNGSPDIYVIHAEGSGLVRLTTGEGAAWSPDGTRIAFTSERDSPGQFDIFLMNDDGSSVSRLTTSGVWSRGAWSPDGTRIAFSSERDSSVNIYLTNLDASNVTRLTDVGGCAYAIRPAWSPDGAKLAFEVGRRDDRGRECPTGVSGIYVINTDGSGLTRLTDRGDHYPAWSPDGAQLVFWRGFQAHDRCSGDLWLMYADGSSQTRLDVTRYGIACSRMPAWRGP